MKVAYDIPAPDDLRDVQVFPARATTRSLLIRATTVGLIVSIAHLLYHLLTPTAHPGDFVWALQTAYTLSQGIDPYGFAPDPLLIPYPLPVALFGVPFLWTIGVLPFFVAGAVFLGISAGLLTWSMLRAGENWRLTLILLSGPFWMAVLVSQWSPLIVATWYIPVLAPLLVLVKPQIALPVAIAHKLSKPGLLIAGVVLLFSLIIDATWPFRFLSMMGPYQSTIPILTLPLGPLLILAALRWRDERGRLLLFMAVMPQRTIYDYLPLWLVPTGIRGLAVLTALSWLVVLAGIPTWPAMFTTPDMQWAIHALYLPALIILLLRKPQVRLSQ
ncbi:MAG: hypothetical protein ABI670_09435 [Chloroflexota bacterium]